MRAECAPAGSAGASTGRRGLRLLAGWLALAGLVCLAAPPVRGAAELCEAWAARAAAERGIPADVMHAIALVETGRARGGRLAPWPWAINLEGEGHYFESRQAALAFAQQALDDGRTSFDLGCFQINHRWHAERFASLAQMLDPAANARYAAAFLAGLHAETGDWEAAAGAYHSRTEVHAARYRARFRSLRAGLAGSPPPARIAEAEPPAPPGPRRTLPLTGGASRLGSLVPMEASRPGALFAPARGLGG